MGDIGVRFTYTEDPDGTLIEFVETQGSNSEKIWFIFKPQK